MGTREVILDGAVVADTWAVIDDDAPIPPVTLSATGHERTPKIIISWERWVREREALAGRAGLGVRVSNTVDVRALTPDLRHWAMVVLHFPKFGDGRAYSQARVLREQLGYNGHIRASGQVLRDQVFLMQRCGFDVLEVEPSRRASEVARGMCDFSVTYQPAGDEPLPLFRRRDPRPT